MEGTTRKVKMFDMKSWTSSSNLAWVLLPTPLGSMVEEEDYCAVSLLAVLKGCQLHSGRGHGVCRVVHTPGHPSRHLPWHKALSWCAPQPLTGEESWRLFKDEVLGLIHACQKCSIHPSILLMPRSPCHYHIPLPTLQPRANL